eukprot:80002-Pleurochrysis_carterae.AAC.2
MIHRWSIRTCAAHHTWRRMHLVKRGSCGLVEQSTRQQLPAQPLPKARNSLYCSSNHRYIEMPLEKYSAASFTKLLRWLGIQVAALDTDTHQADTHGLQHRLAQSCGFSAEQAPNIGKLLSAHPAVFVVALPLSSVFLPVRRIHSRFLLLPLAYHTLDGSCNEHWHENFTKLATLVTVLKLRAPGA